MNRKDLLITITLMLFIFALSFFILDHFLVWKFHLQVLAQPCMVATDVCKEVAPFLSSCFEQKSINYSDVKVNGKNVGVISLENINLSLR